MILQILYVVLCLYLIQKLWQRKPKNNDSRPPELSGGLPIIGHALKIIGDRKHAFRFIKWMSREAMANGGVMTLKVGPRALYIISDPDDCLKVANECLEKDYYYKFAIPFLGNGLTIADVPLWKRHRKFMSSVFRQKNLNEFLVVFNHQAKRLVKQFKPEMGKKPFNHEKYIQLNMLESICMTSFGADVTEFGGTHQQYMKGVDQILKVLAERFQKIWMHSDFVYDLSNLKKEQDICIGNIRKFTKAILAKRKAEMEKDKNNSNNSDEFTPFMSYLLKLEGPDSYSEDDVLYESNTLVAGGYDTSTRTNTLILMMLGTYSDVQKKVYDELQEVFGDSLRDVTKDDLPKLIYLEAVIKETMRLYPVAPIIARYIVKDVQLKNYTLKAGHGVGIMIWGMHRHAMWGPDPELFRPERWLDGSLKGNTNAFGGFSLGRRSCIGKIYAMMAIKTTLAHILRSYHIRSDISGLEFEMDVLLKPTSGQHISIGQRSSLNQLN